MVLLCRKEGLTHLVAGVRGIPAGGSRTLRRLYCGCLHFPPVPQSRTSMGPSIRPRCLCCPALADPSTLLLPRCATIKTLVWNNKDGRLILRLPFQRQTRETAIISLSGTLTHSMRQIPIRVIYKCFTGHIGCRP